MHTVDIRLMKGPGGWIVSYQRKDKPTAGTAQGNKFFAASDALHWLAREIAKVENAESINPDIAANFGKYQLPT